MEMRDDQFMFCVINHGEFFFFFIRIKSITCKLIKILIPIGITARFHQWSFFTFFFHYNFRTSINYEYWLMIILFRNAELYYQEIHWCCHLYGNEWLCCCFTMLSIELKCETSNLECSWWTVECVKQMHLASERRLQISIQKYFNFFFKFETCKKIANF